MTPETQGTSTRPYLIRALHSWCVDNGFTPYLAVYVDQYVRVPLEYVKNNEIVLNVSYEATNGLTLGNDVVEFHARFGGIARHIVVPIDHVIAIYARENGQGMAFPFHQATGVENSVDLDKSLDPPHKTNLVSMTGGLRLASSSPSDTTDLTKANSPDDEPDLLPPTDPTASPTGKPALKRIK